MISVGPKVNRLDSSENISVDKSVGGWVKVYGPLEPVFELKAKNTSRLSSVVTPVYAAGDRVSAALLFSSEETEVIESE